MRLMFAATVVLSYGLCWGQSSPSKTSDTDAGLLGGPKVDRPAAKASLVRRDFNGKLERLESSPEEAALRTMTLTEDEKKNTQLVLNERAAIFDKAISGNIPMLLKLQGFRDADKKDKLAVLQEWGQALAPLKAHGKLADELAAGLSQEHGAQLKSMVKEYWDAVIEEGMKADETMGERPKKAQVIAREYLLGLGAEIKRSYDRIIAGRVGQLDEALKKVDATPEQSDKIKAMSLEYFQKTLGKPTAEQKRDFVLKVLGVLDAKQKAALLKEFFAK